MALSASLSYSLSLSSPLNARTRKRSGELSRLSVRSSASPVSAEAEGVALVREAKKRVERVADGSPTTGSSSEEAGAPELLEVFYDDGYGTTSVMDYLDVAKQLIRPDSGPPRWFCPVECGRPIKDAPVLLFLPGVDGVGLGLILHHKSLGKAFEVRCMHIPAHDRTPFEGLLKFVEDTIKHEHTSCPNKPIYLVGDSFGGCLALAVAARNPTLDLILILANPGTSFGDSQLQPVLPILEALPNELHVTVPYLLSFIMGDPLKLAMASVDSHLSPFQTIDKLSKSLTSMLPRLSDLADIIPKETLIWKLKLLRTAAAYANSRLHSVKVEVLVLASGNDKMLPSKAEAERLWNRLPKCKVRYFKDHGHSILLEDGIHLLTIIKGTHMYRRWSRYDYVSDYLPPSRTEYQIEFERENGFFRIATNPVVLSTVEDGKIVYGLGGVPNEGPILLVGYHMLLGFELSPLVDAFIREKNTVIRGMAHPIIFSNMTENSLQEESRYDLMRLFGALPVTPSNMYKLLSSKSFVLLYPGGAREALHRKGEEYQLFWPEQPEFIRMAARFGATIVPFGTVGEDDVGEIVLDYNDQMSIPFIRDWIKDLNERVVRLRADSIGEVANQDLFLPVVLPKVPGRFYYLFGKPYHTKGQKELLTNREKANEVYLHIKSEVERIISYLRTKREEDPYRSIFSRTVYQATWGSTKRVPTFDP